MRSLALGLLLTFVGITAANAASCSSWKATCEKRGGGADCQVKFDQCMATGTFTEGAKFGGATHSGVTKK